MNQITCFAIIWLSVAALPAEAQPRTAPKATGSEKLVNCIGTLDAYAGKWAKDSLGDTGFRDIFSSEVLLDCRFTGVAWSRIAGFFGTPKSARKDERGNMKYRFLVADSLDFLEIVVNPKGLVIRMRIERSCS